jgi:hypothetical protein
VAGEVTLRNLRTSRRGLSCQLGSLLNISGAKLFQVREVNESESGRRLQYILCATFFHIECWNSLYIYTSLRRK